MDFMPQDSGVFHVVACGAISGAVNVTFLHEVSVRGVTPELWSFPLQARGIMLCPLGDGPKS